MISRLVVVDIAPSTSPNRADTELFISLMKSVNLEARVTKSGSLSNLRANLMKEWQIDVPVCPSKKLFGTIISV